MGQKVHAQPISLLEKTNNEIMEIPEGHICCGSAGTYNILQSKIAKQLLEKKVNNIESLNPDFFLREILVVLPKFLMVLKFQYYIQLKF